MRKPAAAHVMYAEFYCIDGNLIFEQSISKFNALGNLPQLYTNALGDKENEELVLLANRNWSSEPAWLTSGLRC